MDAVTEFAILLAVSVGAHMLVAYVFAPKAAVRRLKAFFREDVEAAELIAMRFGPALTAWMASPEGKAEADKWVTAAAEFVRQKLQSWLEGAAGGAQRTADAKATALIGAIDFGNPVLNGMWSMIDPTTKKRALGKIAGLVRRGAAAEVGGEEAAEPANLW